MIRLHHIKARVARLHKLTRDLRKEIVVISDAEDPLLYLERRQYLTALRVAVEGLDEARVVLAGMAGLLAPSLFSVGDVPHLAALNAPRRLLIVGGATPRGKKLTGKDIQDGYAFTREVFDLYKAGERLSLLEAAKVADVAAMLGG